MIDRPEFDVWITKYALTKGIFRCKAKGCFDISDDMICVHGKYLEYFHGSDWHRDEQSAVDRANEMARKKIETLKKQIRRLELLEFQPVRK